MGRGLLWACIKTMPMASDQITELEWRIKSNVLVSKKDVSVLFAGGTLKPDPGAALMITILSAALKPS